MIYVTGDTHGKNDFAKLQIFMRQNPQLTHNDYVIITGDFGGVWREETLEKDLQPYVNLPFTVLFCDGNHENFDLLDAFPVECWKGGKVHRIADNILHLMRGQVYDIDGKSFFVFGGATSIDRYRRVKGLEWWQQEVPSDGDIVEANKNLEKVGYKVDYIISHSCDEKALYYPPLSNSMFQKGVFLENKILSYFEEVVDYKHWYFGHFHVDGNLTDRKTVVYLDVLRVD